MKLKVLVVAAALSLSTGAFAQAFANAQMFVNPTVAIARIYNVWGRPVLCEGRVIGLTAQFPIFANFRDVIPAGQYREAYVYTNAYNPFINASSEIYCQ
ncbi:hypothetical protein [Peredibacter starrii]|uniref:Uncharacterized protein n=1 Tax=Peredibacter starrii TaxID=28202 RepID=A0AAX4HN30_9BACT|nr:hypothetical protein [Peredibacter starrii]WPU64656.1 hypothetical protein SOO65_18335 [Peredibacter starrii]